jgi:hypothetical protein
LCYNLPTPPTGAVTNRATQQPYSTSRSAWAFRRPIRHTFGT